MPHCSHCKTPYQRGERFCPEDGGAIVEETADAKDPLIGRKVAHRYFIKRMIGKGGMGAVYEGEHVGLDKKVALKFILDKYTEDKDVVLRFHREARAASRIGHDNIVDITDIDETEDSRHFIAMEFLEGSDLSDEIKAAGRLEPQRALRIIAQVLSGLGAAHEKGIVHRDMKPENVFLTSSTSKGKDFVKIMDFGISKFISAHDSRVRLTETGAVIGTPIYMAPEQAQAAEDMDHRVDLYAVGVMLYEMLAGQPPFVAQSYLALVTKHLHEAPPPLRSLRPELSIELEQVVHKALEKQPHDRYSSAAEFSRALPPTNRIFGRAASDAQSNPDQMARFAPTLPSGQQAVVEPPPISSQIPAQMIAFPAASVQQPPQLAKPNRLPYVMVAAAAVLAIGLVVFALVVTSADEPAAEKPTPTAAVAGDSGDSDEADTESTPTANTQRGGLVEIRSAPADADVFIDGENMGKTPLDIELAPGDYKIELRKHGYVTSVKSESVSEGYKQKLDVTLADVSSGQESTARSRRSKRKKSGRRTKKLAGPSVGPTSTPDRDDVASTPKKSPKKSTTKSTTKNSKTGSKSNPYTQ